MSGDEETLHQDVSTNQHSTFTIASVEGRKSSAARGLPPAHSMSLVGDDGSALKIERLKGSTPFNVRKLAIAERLDFDRCPICLTEAPTSREHVPPRGLGGGVLTVTCLRCNNEFGSRIENDLQDWFDDATRPYYVSDAVAGARRGPRMLLRRNGDGAPVFLVDVGKVDPAIHDMFDSGDFRILHKFPDDRKVRLALLKSAYLASCCLLGSIPMTPKAVAIRDILMRTRDAPRADPIAESPLLTDLRFHRSYKEGQTEVALVGWREGDQLEFGVSLAQTVLVSWPLEPLVPVRTEDTGAASDGLTAESGDLGVG